MSNQPTELTSGDVFYEKSVLLGLPYGSIIEDDRGFRYEVVGTDDDREYLNFLTGVVVDSSALAFPIEFIW